MTNRYRILIVLGIIVLAGAGVLLWAVFGPNHFERGALKVVTVSRGETFAALVDTLETNGLLRSKGLFTLTARLLGGTDRIQIGRYEFADGASNVEIFTTIRSGRNNLLMSVTVPEGLMTRTQARLFARVIGADSARYAKLAYDPEFARSLGIDAPSLEGYLMPQTYGFYWQVDEEEILRTMVGEFKRFFTDSLAGCAQQMGWTPHQIVTLAAIVEGEAVLADERPVIAGVYLNRLRRGMRLEADPTIQFVIPDGPRRLRYSDLRIASPYNTYRSPGLPPGPVNNPGKDAILSVLAPTVHNYYFFVANGRGGHWFSSTYAQHLRYVRQYRRERSHG